MNCLENSIEEVVVWAPSPMHIGVWIRSETRSFLDTSGRRSCGHLMAHALERALDATQHIQMTSSRGSWNPSWGRPREMPTDPSGTSMHVRFRPEACASGGDRDADACNRFANKSMASLGVPGATAFPPAAIGPCLSSSHESSAALPDVCADTFLGRAALRSDVLRAAADLTPCGRASGVGMLLIQQSVVEDALYAALRVSATAVPSSSSSGGEEHTATVDLLVVFSDEDVGSEFKARLRSDVQTVYRFHESSARELVPDVMGAGDVLSARMATCPNAGFSTLRILAACLGRANVPQRKSAGPHACSAMHFEYPLFQTAQVAPSTSPGARLKARQAVWKECLASDAGKPGDVLLVGGVGASQYLAQDRTTTATVAVDIFSEAPLPEGATVCVRQQLPWNLNPRVSTLTVSALGEAGSSGRAPVMQQWTAWDTDISLSQVVEGGPIRDVVMDALTSEREKAQAHFARADLVSRTGSHMVLTCTPARAAEGASTVRITFEIERVPVAVDETPADLARGYEVAPAQVWVMAPPTDARGMATGGETSGLNGGSGGAAAWRASPWQEARSNLLLVSGPYGDHSMLFNVPVLASLATMILVSLVISALTSALHLDYAKGGADAPKKTPWAKRVALGVVVSACGFIVVYESDELQQLLGIEHLFT